MPSTRRVMVFEPSSSGHRLYYVQLIVEELLARGHHAVIATSSSAMASDEWKQHLGSLSPEVEILQCGGTSIKRIANLAAAYCIDHVVVPSGDMAAVQLGIGRSWRSRATISLLIMRENPQQSRLPGVAFLKGGCKKLLLHLANNLDGVRICLLKSSLWSGRSAFSTAKDPVSLAAEVNTLKELSSGWGLDPHRYWFGIVGAVSARKNLPLVVASLETLEGGPYGLVVGGKMTQDVREKMNALLQRPATGDVRIEIHDRLLNDVELDSLICAVDCVILAHSNEGSSGIMGKAAAVGTRIAAAGAKSLRADCAQVPQLAEWADLTEIDIRHLLEKSSRLSKPEPCLVTSGHDFVSALL